MISMVPKRNIKIIMNQEEQKLKEKNEQIVFFWSKNEQIAEKLLESTTSKTQKPELVFA